jgi:hypothetical protein
LTDNSNTVTITVRYGELDEPLEWCQEHCVGAWDLVNVIDQAGYANGTYQFEFSDERDITLFTLRWA